MNGMKNVSVIMHCPFKIYLSALKFIELAG